MKRKILSILILVSLVSCSKEEKLKGERMLVFEPKQAVVVDSKLALTDFKVPARKAGGDWHGKANKLNKNVENFAVNADLLKTGKVETSIHFDGKDSLVVDGVLYQVERLGLIKAKDIKTGKKIWKNRIRVSDKRMKYGQISYFDGKIFVSTGYDDVIALDAKNGREIWRRKIKAVTISVPTFDDSRVFVSTNDNKTYALNQKTGDILWIHSGIFNQTGVEGASAPVVSDDKVIASYSSGEVYVLNAEYGREIFSFDLNLPKVIDFKLNDVDATPIVKDGVLYASGNGGWFVAVNITNGEFIWKREFATITDFWLAGDYIYIVNNENVVGAFYKRDGRVRWATQLKQYESNKETKREIYDEVMVVNDNILAKNYDGDIVVLQAENGRILTKIKNKKRIGLELVARWLIQ